MLDVAASDGISIAASEDACTWPARRSTLQRIRGTQRALMAPSCEGQTFPRLPASLVPGESATACQPRNAQHTTCSLWEWHHLRLPCVQHLDTMVSGLVVRLHSALTQRHTASGALRHRLLQHITTPPGSPGSPVRRPLRTAQCGTPNSGTTLPWLITTCSGPVPFSTGYPGSQQTMSRPVIKLPQRQ
jgi:hypothetical protein